MMINIIITFARKSLIAWIGMITTITLLVGCGGGGNRGSQSPPNTPGNEVPEASITAPTETHFNEGENITFDGSATDEEDGDIDGSSLVWTSNIDGPIGTGPTLTTCALTTGDHEITLSATDTEGDTHTTVPVSIHIEPTRFIKMGLQTTGMPDATNAFDGDQSTATTIMTPETEYIHFKANIGNSDVFFFNILLGASTKGSRMVIQGLHMDDNTWRHISGIDLETEKTATIKVTEAQNYKDTDGYINLRAHWEGGGSDDSATIFELWRTNPFHNGVKTIGVNGYERAFDGDPETSATFTASWGSTDTSPFLHFKIYVGTGAPDAFVFKVSHNSIAPDHFLSIDIENINSSPDAWKPVATYGLDTAKTRLVTVMDVQDYLDEDGFISLRARWQGHASTKQMAIYEISRVDPFSIGPQTSFNWIDAPTNTIDGDPDTFTNIPYYWSELDHFDSLHLQAYAGDTSKFTFSIKAGLSEPISGYELIVEGRLNPDNWSIIERISLDNPITMDIELPNARPYVDADGRLNLRVRWESDSGAHDAYIYDINRIKN